MDQPVDVLLAAHDGWVRALTQLPSAKGVTLASGGEEGAVRLWDLVDGRFHAHTIYHSVNRGFRDRPASVDLLDREGLCEHLCALLAPETHGGHGTTAGPQESQSRGHGALGRPP